jgi:uncharacterized protein YraI
MKRITGLSILLAFFLLLSACNLFQVSPQASDGLAGTQAALEQTQIALAIEQTMAAMSVPGAVSAVTVTVSVDTNCRLGPGTLYEIVGVLPVGQVAEVVGRSASSDNWIISLPSNLAVTCWVWGQYATVSGDTSTLPVITPPPAPTLTPTVPLVLILPVLTIENNGATTIFYVYISLSSSASWGDDQLGNSVTLPPGASHSWSIAPGRYDVKVEDSTHVMLKTWFSLDINAPMILTVP